MGLFSKSPDKKLLSPKDGATTLIVCAQIRMDSDNLAKISTDPEILHSINFLIYMTRFAIITNWLQLVEIDTEAGDRARAVLNSVEELTFSTMPNELQPSFSKKIQELTSSISELHEIDGKQGELKATTSAGMIRWCRRWLSNISDDDAFLTRTSALWSGAFFIYVREAMSSLARSVEAVLFEPQ